VIKKTITIGKILANVIKPPAVNIVQANPDNIVNNKCPAVIFAANRTPNDTGFIKCDINSIITKNGAATIGAPNGINIEK